jgi:DnaJ-class molecular chaperone
MQYTTKNKCQYNGKIWKQGDALEFTGEVVPCQFCEGLGKIKGNKCQKCDGTGRSNPPHHFMPVTPENLEAKKAEIEAEMSEIDAIRAEMDAMGKAYDKRWKLQRMKDALIAARKSG